MASLSPWLPSSRAKCTNSDIARHMKSPLSHAQGLYITRSSASALLGARYEARREKRAHASCELDSLDTSDVNKTSERSATGFGIFKWRAEREIECATAKLELKAQLRATELFLCSIKCTARVLPKTSKFENVEILRVGHSAFQTLAVCGYIYTAPRQERSISARLASAFVLHTLGSGSPGNPMWRARLIEVRRVPQLVDNGIQRKALSGAADCTREKRHRFKEKKKRSFTTRSSFLIH